MTDYPQGTQLAQEWMHWRRERQQDFELALDGWELHRQKAEVSEETYSRFFELKPRKPDLSLEAFINDVYGTRVI